MVDEVRVVKGLRGYGIKEEFAHARSAKVVENVSTLCQMSKCGAGEEGIFCRERFDIMQNVEMCELEKEMDKDGSVVFRLGWATR
jgi:hypothetical protein